MERLRSDNQAFLLVVAQTAAVANYCDHAEHNERVDQDWVLHAAADFIRIATELSSAEGLSVVDLYARRLEAVEARSPAGDGTPPGGEAARRARSWRDLQLVQLEHDRRFHPDVLGLMKSEQLRHYAMHLSKIAGAMARNAMGEDNEDELLHRRVPDLFLFGIKLHTVMGRKLDETRPLPEAPTPARAIHA